MKLTGHKTESIFRRYAIVLEADLAEGVRKVAALQVSNDGADSRASAGIAGGAPLGSSTVRAQSGEREGDSRSSCGA